MACSMNWKPRAKRPHMTLKLIDAAKADLRDIRAYTKSNHGQAQAVKYMAILRTAFKDLRGNAKIGYSIAHIRVGYRCYKVEHHRIIYKLDAQDIIVIAVLHERQLPQRHIAQREE